MYINNCVVTPSYHSPDPSRLQYDDPVFVQSSEQFSTQLSQHSEPGDQSPRQVQQEVYTTLYQVWKVLSKREYDSSVCKVTIVPWDDHNFYVCLVIARTSMHNRGRRKWIRNWCGSPGKMRCGGQHCRSLTTVSINLHYTGNHTPF